MQVVQIGGRRREFREHVVVVYERTSGRVLHVHHLLTASKAKRDTAELERAAIAHAAASGHPEAVLAAVRLSAEPPPRQRFRIDPATRTLVVEGEPAPLPRSRRRPPPRGAR